VREGCTNSGSRIPNVGFFCDYVTSWLDTVGGITDTQLRTGGLNIVTTLDPAIQASTQKGITGAVANTSPMTAVLPVLDPRNGDVLAMATSKNYGIPTSDKDHTHTTLPVFTSYTGYGASTYKLFPLLTALSTGIPSDWKLQQPVNNDPYLPRNCATDAKTFNDDSKVAFWNRNETLQDATVKSSNTYFVALADQGFGCDLQPIINIAKKLGLKGLTQPSTEPKLTIEQTIVDYQRVNQLVLGDVPTSPLEIAGAYAAVANGGVFNAPAPVLSIKDSNGDPLTVKRSAGVRAVPEQIALQAVQILTGDTKAPGTSADAFSGWYGRNGSLVAGKTGTSVAVVNGKDTKENASLWFVGLTPKLVAATALVNFDNPHNPAAGLKGLRHPGTEAYGEYASRVWLKSLSATLKGDDWTWASPGSADGDDVPDIVGDDMDEAKAKLSDAGFKMALVDPDPANKVYCPSSQPYGKVAYYGPQKAQQGDTVTVCPSLGQPQQIYVPPKPTPKPKPTKKPTKTTSPTGATSTAPATGGGGGGGGNGRGRQSPH
jgi:membrane peptidoglycan carboxypeptidase